MKIETDRTRRDEVKVKRRLKGLAWDKGGSILFPFLMKHWSHNILTRPLSSLSIFFFFKKNILLEVDISKYT
jgi:hypothetical protein